jgi:PRC-barrel domain
MADTISWIATVATVIAASMTAANLGSRITGYGFCVFLLGSLSWLATALLTGQPALLWTNIVLTILNVFGIWRWLGRQSRIEEGASQASEKSEQTPGEALFAVSTLLKATVRDRSGRNVGNCIDGMAGCSSGRLQYVVISKGGVGGIGETLYRLPWGMAEIEAERLVLDRTDTLKEITGSEWPTR